MGLAWRLCVRAVLDLELSWGVGWSLLCRWGRAHPVLTASGPPDEVQPLLGCRRAGWGG